MKSTKPSLFSDVSRAIVVTRHPGALAWMNKKLPKEIAVESVVDFDPAMVGSGTLVVGTLPVNLVAEVNARGGRYLHLTLRVPPAMRGRELSSHSMEEHGASLEEFRVEAVARPAIEVSPAAPREIVMACIASEQVQQNLLPALQLAPRKLLVVVSDDARSDVGYQRLRDALLKAGFAGDRIAKIQGMPSAGLGAMIEWTRQFGEELRKQSASPAARIVVNLTGGKKTMAMALDKVLSGHGDCFYCDTEAGYLEWLLPDGSRQVPITRQLTLDELLASQGLVQPAERKDESRPAWPVMRQRSSFAKFLLENAGRCDSAIGAFNWTASQAFDQRGRFTGATQVSSRPARKGGGLEHMTPLVGANAEAFLLAKKLGLINIKAAGTGQGGGSQKQLDWKSITFRSEGAARFLNGLWLEEYAYVVAREVLAKLGLPASEARIGLRIALSGTPERDLTDLDLAICHRSRLFVAESKTLFMGGDKPGDIIAKLESVARAYGGRLSKAVLLSARAIDKAYLKRANELGLDILVGKEITTRLPSEIEKFVRNPGP